MSGSPADSDAILDTVLGTLERYAPGLRGLVVAGEIITPGDMEREWGLTGGHIFHGELSLDQMLMMRPLLGFGLLDAAAAMWTWTALRRSQGAA